MPASAGGASSRHNRAAATFAMRHIADSSIRKEAGTLSRSRLLSETRVGRTNGGVDRPSYAQA